MRNLINFILKNVHWQLFFLLSFLSILLIVNNGLFQRSKFLAGVQEVTGNMYSVSSNIKSYINLREANDDLLNRIAELETVVYAEKKQLELLKDTSFAKKGETDSLRTAIYTFTPAHVVYNSISNTDNYITLDKGSNDGIKEDMGVVSPNGIVGVVMSVSPNFSLVIPVLNSKFRLSCKTKNSNYFGLLVWDGSDPRYTYLQELPRHVEFDLSDTIVTNGYSIIFPEGLLVGTIVDSQKQKNDNYNSLKIRLFTDFTTLTDVLIITNRLQEEQRNLHKIVKI